jgi:nucleoid DNA-binding protein
MGLMVLAPNLKNFLDDVRQGVRQNGKLTLTGFGTFKVVKKKARNQRLPNGTIIKVPARSVVKFVPSKKFLTRPHGGKFPPQASL